MNVAFSGYCFHTNDRVGFDMEHDTTLGFFLAWETLLCIICFREERRSFIHRSGRPTTGARKVPSDRFPSPVVIVALCHTHHFSHVYVRTWRMFQQAGARQVKHSAHKRLLE
jgi:hypothetical protein